MSVNKFSFELLDINIQEDEIFCFFLPTLDNYLTLLPDSKIFVKKSFPVNVEKIIFEVL